MREMLKKGLLAGIAIGSIGLMAGTAGAAPLSSVLTGGHTFFSDDSAESLKGSADTRVDVGERLRGTFTMNTVVVNGGAPTSIGGTSSVNELTGIFDITVSEKVAGGALFSSGGLCTAAVTGFCFKFVPTATFAGEAILAGFGTTAGAMIAFFEDPANNYDRGLATEAAVEATATDGSAFWLFGFDDPDDFWTAAATSDDISVAGVLPALTQFGNVQAGLSLISQGSGPEVAAEAVACFDASQPGLTGVISVDVCGQGSLIAKGAPGSPGAISTPYDSLDDVNFNLVTIPEPTTLALLGIGLLGLGFAARRRKA